MNVEGKVGPGPLTPGPRLLFRLLSVALPSTRSRCSQFVFLRSTFVVLGSQLFLDCIRMSAARMATTAAAAMATM